jgi:hypothetical protein
MVEGFDPPIVSGKRVANPVVIEVGKLRHGSDSLMLPKSAFGDMPIKHPEVAGDKLYLITLHPSEHGQGL